MKLLIGALALLASLSPSVGHAQWYGGYWYTPWTYSQSWTPYYQSYQPNYQNYPRWYNPPTYRSYWQQQRDQWIDEQMVRDALSCMRGC